MSAVHISRGTRRRFAAVVRAPGHQKFTMLGEWSRSERVATLRLAAEMLTGRWKRGAVLFISDYYEPVPILRIDKP